MRLSSSLRHSPTIYIVFVLLISQTMYESLVSTWVIINDDSLRQVASTPRHSMLYKQRNTLKPNKVYRVCLYICKCMCIYTYACMYECMYARTHARERIYIYIYIEKERRDREQ